MSLQVPAEEYDEIARVIASEDSPVGIDAKETHIIILHKLSQIERRLTKLEEALGSDPGARR